MRITLSTFMGFEDEVDGKLKLEWSYHWVLSAIIHNFVGSKFQKHKLKSLHTCLQ